MTKTEIISWIENNLDPDLTTSEASRQELADQLHGMGFERRTRWDAGCAGPLAGYRREWADAINAWYGDDVIAEDELYEPGDGPLSAHHTLEGWTVSDFAGGVWRPNEDAAREIEAADDPAGCAERICETTPMRGRWDD